MWELEKNRMILLHSPTTCRSNTNVVCKEGLRSRDGGPKQVEPTCISGLVNQAMRVFLAVGTVPSSPRVLSYRLAPFSFRSIPSLAHRPRIHTIVERRLAGQDGRSELHGREEVRNAAHALICQGAFISSSRTFHPSPDRPNV